MELGDSADLGNLAGDGGDFAPIEAQNPDDTGDSTAGASAAEAFFDAKSLPPELQGQWKRMQAAYTRRMTDIRGAEQAAQTVQRFYADPDFARQVLQERAAQLGLSLGPQRTQETRPETGTPGGNSDGPPLELIAAIRDELPPETQWMAESQARAFWRANKAALAPILQRLERDDAARLRSDSERQRAELSAAEAEMDESFPLWREDERSLGEILSFLTTPGSLRHPKYGNKLALIYRALQSHNIGAAAANAQNRRAGQNRTTTGGARSQQASNLEQRILTAPTRDEAFRLAAAAAVEGT